MAKGSEITQPTQNQVGPNSDLFHVSLAIDYDDMCFTKNLARVNVAIDK
jgi:hypothetical protein